MDKYAADGLLIDVRGVDMASLLTEDAAPSMKTALDRILMSSADSCNEFNNSID